MWYFSLTLSRIEKGPGNPMPASPKLLSQLQWQNNNDDKNSQPFTYTMGDTIPAKLSLSSSCLDANPTVLLSSQFDTKGIWGIETLSNVLQVTQLVKWKIWDSKSCILFGSLDFNMISWSLRGFSPGCSQTPTKTLQICRLLGPIYILPGCSADKGLRMLFCPNRRAQDDLSRGSTEEVRMHRYQEDHPPVF